jgi:prolipoprotein diacylglyceryl transferase
VVLSWIRDFHEKTVLFRVGKWVVTTYAVLVALAFAVGASLVLWFDAMTGQDVARKARFYFLVGAPLVLFGLRGFSVLLEWRELFRRPLATLVKPGYMLHGGIAGGAVALLAMQRYTECSILLAFDAAAFALPMGESIARLGCYVYGCCWGRPTRSSRFGVRYTSPDAKVVRARPDLRGVRIHPVQLYAHVIYLVMFVGFLLLLPYRAFDGMLAALYLIGHSLSRYALEQFRDDDRGKLWGPFTHTNLYSLLMVVGGVAALAVGAGGTVTPVKPGVGLLPTLATGSILGWVVVFGLTFGLVYGVHYGKVGQWISSEPKPASTVDISLDPEPLHEPAQ